MYCNLEEIKRLPGQRDQRVFIGGNYTDPVFVGLLDKMAYWVRSFKDGVFYPVTMKNFVVPPPNEEPDWFKEFVRSTLPRFLSERERDVLTAKQRSEIASTIYIVENCGYIFIELTSHGELYPIPEFLVAYRRGMHRHVFMKRGHRIGPMLTNFVRGSNLYYYANEDSFERMINSILQTILESNQIYDIDAESLRKDEEELEKSTVLDTIRIFAKKNPEAEVIILELFDRGRLRVDELRGALVISGYNVDIRRTNTILRNLTVIGAILRTDLKYELTTDGKDVLS